jgi:hypothetical protein
VRGAIVLEIAMKPPPLGAEAERTFRYFNKHLFGNGLPSPLVIITFDRKVGIKYRPGTFELALGSGIEKWTPSQFVCEMLHEMLHLYNNQRGVTDCTSNQYHNQEFVNVALEVGFYVGKHRTRGMACTSFEPIDEEHVRVPDTAVNQRLNFLVERLRFNGDILKCIQKTLKAHRRATPSKTFLVKWVCQCPAPHNCIRSGRRPDGPNPLQVKCMKCDSMFTAAKEDEALSREP